MSTWRATMVHAFRDLMVNISRLISLFCNSIVESHNFEDTLHEPLWQVKVSFQ